MTGTNNSEVTEGAGPTGNESPDSTVAVGAKSSAIRWSKVILTAIVIVVLGAAGSGIAWYAANIEPALHPVHGYVFLDGEPMNGGVILLDHADGWPGALGAIGKDGRFELTTDGVFGAYEGTNYVTFTLMDSGFPPTSLLPSKYNDLKNPPFTMEVDAFTKDKDLRFELKGRIKKE